MTDNDEPLRVRVARTLGCKPYRSRFGGEEWCCPCGDGRDPTHGRPETLDGDGSWYVILPYGEDSPEGWAATGPLVKRFGLSVMPGFNPEHDWMAMDEEMANETPMHEDAPEHSYAGADTPCEAIALVIVSLHAAGRLTEKD